MRLDERIWKIAMLSIGFVIRCCFSCRWPNYCRTIRVAALNIARQLSKKPILAASQSLEWDSTSITSTNLASEIRVLANEKASNRFANLLLYHITTSIWPDEIVLDWVKGCDSDTSLISSREYPPSPLPIRATLSCLF